VFCDRLFQAFRHQGYREAGAKLECRVKSEGKSAKIADLLWGTRLLLQIKSRGNKLGRYSRQAFKYWFNLVPQHPRYVANLYYSEPLLVRVLKLRKSWRIAPGASPKKWGRLTAFAQCPMPNAQCPMPNAQY
jgi:hypothetical protein